LVVSVAVSRRKSFDSYLVGIGLDILPWPDAIELPIRAKSKQEVEATAARQQKR
jgi:hypothetical protein